MILLPVGNQTCQAQREGKPRWVNHRIVGERGIFQQARFDFSPGSVAICFGETPWRTLVVNSG